jgi:pilus assembly protein CpaC
VIRNIAISFVLIAGNFVVGDFGAFGSEPYTPPQQPPAIADSADDQNTPGNKANRKLLEQKLAERDRLQREIDELRRATGTPQQILMKIRAVEINRSKLRRLGVDWSTADGNQKSVSSVAELLQPNASSSLDGMAFGIVGPGDGFPAFLQAMESHNIAKVLAEPAIAVVSGRPASFHVGGEIPMPAGPNSGKAVEFVNFGTQVDMLAAALGNGKVRMELRVRLSEPDFSRAIAIEGQRVPTFNVRQCDTAFELPFGQSAVLTGMVQVRDSVVITAEGQRKTETEEIETLFIATPEIVARPEIVAPPEVAKAYDAPSSVK